MNNKLRNQNEFKYTAVGWIPTEWECLKIKSLTKVITGGTPKTTEEQFWNGNIRWLKSGDLNLKKIYDVSGRISTMGLKNSNAQLIPPQSVLIGLAGQGKTRGTAAINMVELCTNQSVAAILPNEKIFPMYLYYSLDFRYEELRKLSTGDGGRGGLNLKLINNLYISFPPLPDQEAIANILTLWDDAIQSLEELLNQKKRLKKSLAQMLVTGNNRLKGYTSLWRKYKMREVFERVTRKNSDLNNNVVTISAQKGFVKQTEYFNKVIASNILDNYIRIHRGEFCYNKSYSKGYPWGAIKRLSEYDDAVVTPLYICFGIKENDMHSGEFFEQYFEANLLDEGLTKIAHEGGRAHGLLNVTPFDFLDLTITIPDKNEQVAIANVLQTADQEIQLLKQKFELLKDQKKGLMQVLLTGKIRVPLNT